MKLVWVLLLVFVIIANVLGRKGFGPTDQEWNYVNVRTGAYMFWWLHYTTADVSDVTERPLIIWLQGGPGGSSTGTGNIGEIGPIDENLKERNYSWTNDANILFVDNPVGTGYSYVEKTSALTTNEAEIAEDFLQLMKGFYEELPKFRKTPLYIFSESYGGKMTADIALRLQEAIKDEDFECNLVGIGLGDSWISPVDSVMTWGPYLKSLGVLDEVGYNAVQQVALETKKAVDEGSFAQATSLWSATENTAVRYGHFDFYNVLTEEGSYNILETGKARYNTQKMFMPYTSIDDEKIEKLMNTDVKIALNISVEWGSQSAEVFNTLVEDFMKPVTETVEKLLDTDLKIVIYNGQLDVIVDTPGTIAWVNRLKWKGSDRWVTADRSTLTVDGILEGFYKKVDNLTFYWVHRSGHMLPYDNPKAMGKILKDITNNYK